MSDMGEKVPFSVERQLCWPEEEGALTEAVCARDAPPALWGAALERSKFYLQAAAYWAHAAGLALTARERHWCESRQAYCEKQVGLARIRARRDRAANR
jgi:hypothetical protein